MNAREKTLTLYARATSNEEFKKSIFDADGDSISGSHDMTEKHLIASMYYGYLVGTKGSNWREGLGF